MDEAREALQETIPLFGRALAVENWVPEPNELNGALRAPISIYWGEALASIAELAAKPSSPVTQVAETLQKIIGQHGGEDATAPE